MNNESHKANAVEFGNIKTIDMEKETHEYKFAMLIEFKTAEDMRAAMKAGSVDFTVFGE